MEQGMEDQTTLEKSSGKIYNSFDLRIGLILKRLFDICASLAGLLALSPFFLVIAFFIKRESPGPVFYGGWRAGRNNTRFKIWKLRTMYENPESYAGPAVTARGDKRITPLGKWLRDTKLNELPQLWNVLIGQMSFVGPRPEDWNIAQTWPEDARREILSMRPGLTSPASIIYHDEEKMLKGDDFMAGYYQNILPDKIRLDRLYIRHHSLLGDIDIIFWTLAVLLPRITFGKIPEGKLFGGPVSRFVRFNISWFLADFVIAFTATSLVGVLWRTTRPIDLGLINAIIFAVALSLAFGLINAMLGLNSVAWSRAVPEDVVGILISSAIVIVLTILLFLSVSPLRDLPIPMLLLIGLLAATGFIGVRYRWRLISGFSSFWLSRRGSLSVGERVLVVGAGEECEFVTWLLSRKYFRYAFSIIGIVDRNPLIQGMRMDGSWVIGTPEDIYHLAQEHDIGLIVMSYSNLEKEERERILSDCIDTGARIVLVSDLMRSLNVWLSNPAGGQEASHPVDRMSMV